MRARPQRLLALAALGVVLATASIGAAGSVPQAKAGRSLADALAKAKAPAPNAARVRAAVPADRYEPAGGCYVVKSEGTGKYVGRAGAAFAATAARDGAEPFLFQAYDLGKYLLFASKKDFLAAEGGTLPGLSGPVGTALGAVKGTGDENLEPVRDPLVGAAGTAASSVDAATLPARNAARSDAIVAAAKPSADAEWVLRATPNGAFTLQLPVDDGAPENPGPVDPQIYGTVTAAKDGALSVGSNANGQATRFALELATGCAAYPEISTNVEGAVPTADTAYEATQGYFDAHLHMMAFEFIGGRSRCGRPWHPYGVEHALVDCPDHEPGGRGAVLEQALSGGDPAGEHDTVGWPTFGYWPKYNSLTHEQVYYRWLERAWMGGVRMFTNLLVDNNVLCEIYPYKKNSCNEMDGVRLQAQRLRELERYIDAQHGGPGRGWFRIVTDPFEARRVVNAGQLAVVMGIEVSVPFDCGEHLDTVRHCDQAKIDAHLDEAYALGVRQMELTNKFDNALTGVTGDSGIQGPVVNAGNKYETGHNWKMGTCDDPHNDRHDKLQSNVADGHDGQEPPTGDITRDEIFAGVLEVFGETGAAPVYPPGPHCNTMGLSELGKSAIQGLIDRGMIFDPDHMSAKARQEAMEFVAGRGYSGVVSSHSWSDDPTYRRILQLGGVVTPHGGSAASFVGKWRKTRAWAEETDWMFGIGFGSDMNGFSTQGGPRNPAPGAGVSYPFTGLGGVQVSKQVSGAKTYDFNTSGVDHYGLYPDWVEDVRIQAGADGAQFMADLANGVEAYLQMWERAIGVQAQSCLTRDDVKKLRRGMSPEEVLAAVGQPKARVDAAYTYCGPDGALTVSFDAAGRLRSAG